MMNKRSIGCLAACSLLLAPVVARAVAVDTPVVTRATAGEGIQLGPTLFYPALSVTGTYDDNISMVSSNPDGGWVTSIAPSLRMVLPVRRFYLGVEGGLDFLNYHGVDQDDSTDWFVGAAVGADFPGGLSFKVADRHAQRHLVASQEYGAGEDSAVNTLTAMVAYAIRSAVKLELSGTRTVPTFELSTRRERVETTVQADLYWKFRPSLSGLVEGSYAAYAYDSNTAQDNSAVQAALGLTWDVTARSTGFAKAGYQWKRYDDQSPALGTENGSYYTVSAGLKHSFTPRTVLGFNLSRASQESDFPENPYYLRSTVDASLSQRLTPKLYGRLNARYGRDEYPNATSYDNPYDTVVGLESGKRTDTSFGGTVSLGFDVTRWLVLELAYGGETRNSTYDTFDFDETRVSMSAKAAF